MRIAVDLDGTITNEVEGWDYAKRTPNRKVIEHINHWYDEGHFITLWSARMKKDRKVTVAWLKEHGVKYNDLVLGKPRFDLYVGDECCHVEDITWKLKILR